jgi:large subunit ribosomal protein L35
MPKMKTKKAISKRVKVTGSGKVIRYAPGSGHLKSRKSSKRLREFRKPRGLSNSFAKQAKRLMGQ